jgi:hypothetical protein
MAVSKHDPHVILKALKDALGLQEKRVRSITLHASVDRFTTAVVELYPDCTSIQGVTDVLRKYQFMRIDDKGTQNG